VQDQPSNTVNVIATIAQLMARAGRNCVRKVAAKAGVVCIRAQRQLLFIAAQSQPISNTRPIWNGTRRQ